MMRCKMCGGDLTIQIGSTIAECEYCGSKQTVPVLDSEKKANLFNRANRLRLACEFDRASSIYERIVAELPEEAEAYWGLVLCRYGIEYVDDPLTGKRIPTCHRSSFNSVTADKDFEKILKLADPEASLIYQTEAKTIEELRQGIIAISSTEEPYDIFICYKETDANGDRTSDSVIAQEVYNELAKRGYRVFFSRISLEDKLGTAYEPYIFAALHSASIMLVFGTCADHYDAVWVKNEWTRFLALTMTDKTKSLIPCYIDMNIRDLPIEFAHLPVQDMKKPGALQELLRGIAKILPPRCLATQHADVSKDDELLEQGRAALLDKNWEEALTLFNQILDMDPEKAEAYLGLYMAQQKIYTREHFAELYIAEKIDDEDKLLRRAKQFAENALSLWLVSLSDQKKEAIQIREIERKQKQAYLASVRKHIAPVQGMLSAGPQHIVGVTTEGNVLVAGTNKDNCCNVTDWYGIRSVYTYGFTTMGVRYDGTVVATGDNRFGHLNVSKWKDIKAIAITKTIAYGLSTDGEIHYVTGRVPWEFNFDEWKHLSMISGNFKHLVGLKTNGNVVNVGIDPRETEPYEKEPLSSWYDIVAIDTHGPHVVGLKADGTVIASFVDRANDLGQCDISDWSDIVAIAAGYSHTVGVKEDGTVVAVGDNKYGQCDVSDWTNIVAVVAGGCFTVGVRGDGQVVTAGYDGDGLTQAKTWRLFESIDTISKEQEKGIELTRLREEQEHLRREQELQYALLAQRAELERERDALRLELGQVKTIFLRKRREEIAARLAIVEHKLQQKKM